MKSFGIIPARGGSKSIPLKNIRKLAGKPLIAHTIKAAVSSNLSRVIVSTESKEIAEVAVSYGAEVMMRPIELAQDNTPTLPVLQQVVSNLNEKFDCVACLQPTSPFRTSKHINESLKLFESYEEADTLVSVIKVPHNMFPYSLMESDNNYLKSYLNQDRIILRRQDKSTLYARNGPAILIINNEKIHSPELYNGKTIAYVMDTVSSIDIDDENDLLMAEYFVKQLIEP